MKKPSLALALGWAASVSFVVIPAVPSAAQASPAPRAVRSVGPPAGYVIVSTTVDVPSGTEGVAHVTCPGTEVPAGGGVFVGTVTGSENSLGTDVNSSFPQGQSWVGRVSNVSGVDGSITVEAACIDMPLRYVVVSTTVDNPSGLETPGTATCPGTRKLLGGGSSASSGDLAVNINSTWPETGRKWRTNMNNGSGGDDKLTVYAICARRPQGYARVSSVPTPNPANTETQSGVFCPAPKRALSVGGFSTLSNLAVNTPLISLFGGVEPEYWANNASLAQNMIETVAVCA
jgi:hypothetical protein